MDRIRTSTFDCWLYGSSEIFQRIFITDCAPCGLSSTVPRLRGSPFYNDCRSIGLVGLREKYPPSREQLSNSCLQTWWSRGKCDFGDEKAATVRRLYRTLES